MPRFYTYGPFNSRRLGLSLGVDILPKTKYCTFDCVYCEIGNTINLVSPYYVIQQPPTHNFYKELIELLPYFPNLDSITFGYNGEPTLNKYLLEYLEITKKVRKKVSWQNNPPRITLFTNSSTLFRNEIRTKVSQFEYILAKVDAGIESVYRWANRPHNDVPKLSVIIDSLINLRKEKPVNHVLTLQCLIYNTYESDLKSNNSADNIENLALAIKKIRPDKVQIYSVARIPSEHLVYSIDNKRKQEIINILKNYVNIDTISINYF